MRRQVADADNLDAGLRHRVIVLDGRAADADGANQHAVLVHDRQSAGERDQPFVRMLDRVERLTGLRQLADLVAVPIPFRPACLTSSIQIWEEKRFP